MEARDAERRHELVAHFRHALEHRVAVLDELGMHLPAVALEPSA